MSIAEARSYQERTRLYLANAAGMLRQRRPEKSGEFLWGAMAEALKAVAALKETRLRTHAEIRRYARDLSKERGDDQLSTSFNIAEMLHSNFYEGFSDLAAVTSHSDRIAEAVERLLSLIPETDETTPEDTLA